MSKEEETPQSYVGVDEYMMDEMKPRKHAMSRKKRRRQEALGEPDGDDEQGSGQPVFRAKNSL